jgi:hypothetical protein
MIGFHLELEHSRGHMCAHMPQPTQAACLTSWLAMAYWRTSMPISQQASGEG